MTWVPPGGRPEPQKQPYGPDGQGAYSPLPGYVLPQQGRSGPAVASLVVSLVGLFPVAFILASIGLVQTRGRTRNGRGFAVAGLILSICQALALAAVAVVFGQGLTADRSSADGGTAGKIAASDRISMLRLRPGDCFNDVPEKALKKELVQLATCTEPHESQVLSVDQLDEGPYPGQEEMDRQSTALCRTAWEARLVQSSYYDLYDISIIQPDKNAWLFYRSVTCVLDSVHGKTRRRIDLSASGRAVLWQSVATGDCMALSAEPTETVEIVRCDKLHNAQAVVAFKLPPGAWPGLARVDDLANSTCRARVAPLLKKHPVAVELSYRNLAPDEEEWIQGDRDVLCVVWARVGQLRKPIR